MLFQLESAGGKGIGNGFGLAGFTNLDVVHNTSLGSKPYVGRTMLHFAIPLSHDRTPTERNPLSVFRNLPAISGDHRLYLALGGKGFLLGDGHLNYGRENIFEMFYTIHVWRGVYGAFDLQHVNNPGYNRDRGPVLVPAVRLHLDL